MRRLVRLLAVGAVAGLLPGGGAVRADPVEDFYTGRTVTIFVSASAGGNYAIHAQALAPHLSAHLPGHPQIIVDYLPGAGGLRAMNFLYTNAPKDGSVLGLVHSSVSYAPLYGIEAAKFDPTKINYLGSLNSTTGICIAWHESGIKTWNDLFEKDFYVGSSGAGAQMEILPLMLNKLFGTKIKVIPGYQGGNEVFVAMERREVDGRCGGLVTAIKSARPDWLPEGKVVIPIQIALERDPQFPDAPALGEFAKDELTRQVLELVLAPMSMFAPVLAPPGVPAERVAALRTAFHAAMNDPAFLANAEAIRIEVNEVDADRVNQILARAYAMSPEVVEAAKEAMDLTGTEN